MSTSTETTAEALESWLGETSPNDHGFTLEKADGTSSYGSAARWWIDGRSTRVVVTDEDGIEIHALFGLSHIHLWSARFDSSTPAHVIIATIEARR